MEYSSLFLTATRIRKCALQFTPDCCKTQKVCKKAVDTYLSAMQFVPDQDKTQEMCDKATDACLPALKFVPNWFVTNKMLET